MKNIGYSQFVEICEIFEPEKWCDWLVLKHDGVYIAPLEDLDNYLTPTERSILSKHPTGDLTKPALSFPCDLAQLRLFLEEQGIGAFIPSKYVADNQLSELNFQDPVVLGKKESIGFANQQQVGNPQQDGMLVGITKHKINNRSHILDAEIQEAKKSSLNSKDPGSVWAELVKMAEAKKGCLLGLDQNEIKYQSGEKVSFFKLKNLRERMRRGTRNTPP
jgi:hypothetical protein